MKETERVGSEEWKHLDRVCKEVTPEEEGEEGDGTAAKVEKEEVRLTARKAMRLSVGSAELEHVEEKDERKKR